MDRLLGSDFDGITTPFEGDAPYGENVQYGERYDAIQSEIQKLTAASSKETSVDWPAVRNLSIELLSEESKDLSIACFLTVALFLEDGYAGARDGLDAIHVFLSEHWEGIFPPLKRKARRANDLRWLIERLAPLVEDRDPKPDESEALEPMRDTATQLGELSRELLAEKAPSFGELISILNKRIGEMQPQQAEVVPEPEATPQESEEPEHPEERPADDAATDEQPAPAQPQTTEPEPAEPSPPPAPAPTPAPAPVSVEEGASAADIRAQVERLIPPLREADPLNPAPYRILRTLKWDGVSGPTSGGKTRIPGPRSHDVTSVRSIYDASDWQGLLGRSEGLFSAGNIWFLDLQRYTTLALQHLDPKGDDSPAALAVKEATRELVQRLPALVDCSYADDLAFASDETRNWLAEISTTDSVRIGGMRPASSDQDTVGLDAGDVQQAVQLLRKKRLTEGMEVLQRGIEKASGPRSRFRARLDAATACLDANQAPWARPMLEALQREADSLTFDLWEQAWAVELYQLLAICYGRLAKASKGEERRSFSTMLTKIKDVLLRLDMQAAAAVDDAI